MKRLASVDRALTGHLYYMSPYECYDSCGTCDGGKCDSCKTRWEVTGWDQEILDGSNDVHRMFATKEEAQEFADAWEKGEI